MLFTFTLIFFFKNAWKLSCTLRLFPPSLLYEQELGKACTQLQAFSVDPQFGCLLFKLSSLISLCLNSFVGSYLSRILKLHFFLFSSWNNKKKKLWLSVISHICYSISYLCVGDHMLELHSLSNVTFPNHLAYLAESTQIFANSISSRSADNLGETQMQAAQLALAPTWKCTDYLVLLLLDF